jgi:hypothetical protein
MALSKQLLTQAVEAALEQIKAELIASVVESLLAEVPLEQPVVNGKPKANGAKTPAPKAKPEAKPKAPAKPKPKPKPKAPKVVAAKPAPKAKPAAKPAPAKKSPTKTPAKKSSEETLVEKMQRVLGNQAAQKKAATPPGAFYNINSGKCLVVSAVSKRTKVFFTATKDDQVIQFAGDKPDGKKKNVALEAAKKELEEEGWTVAKFERESSLGSPRVEMDEPEKSEKPAKKTSTKKGDEAEPKAKKSPAKKSGLKPLIKLDLEEKDGFAVADGYVWSIETDPQAVLGRYDESVSNPKKRCVALTEEDLEDCSTKGYEVLIQQDNTCRKQDAKASGVLLKNKVTQPAAKPVTKATAKVEKIRTEAAKVVESPKHDEVIVDVIDDIDDIDDLVNSATEDLLAQTQSNVAKEPLDEQTQSMEEVKKTQEDAADAADDFAKAEEQEKELNGTTSSEVSLSRDELEFLKTDRVAMQMEIEGRSGWIDIPKLSKRTGTPVKRLNELRAGLPTYKKNMAFQEALYNQTQEIRNTLREAKAKAGN